MCKGASLAILLHPCRGNDRRRCLFCHPGGGADTGPAEDRRLRAELADRCQSILENDPVSKLTHLNIAFENPTNEAGDLSFNRDNDALIAAAQANKVKVLISIGGGSASTDQKADGAVFRPSQRREASRDLSPGSPTMSSGTSSTGWMWTSRDRRSTAITGPLSTICRRR
jgi:hypothetical protein